MNILYILMFAVTFGLTTDCRAASFGVARVPSPVLNSVDFGRVFGGKDGSSLKRDRCGQVRELEFIALPGTVFKILGEYKSGKTVTYRVETDEYPVVAGRRLYMDSRFLELHSNAPQGRKPELPPRERVLAALLDSVGSPYIWGGNVQNGVPELSRYFYRTVNIAKSKGLTLAGLDCSGLLYQATNGWTPRNTEQLVRFGRPVAISGRGAEAVARLLEPLDLIVWNGHVLIVLDRERVIESRLECGVPGNGGVVTTPLLQRLNEIMRTRRAMDDWPTAGKKGNDFVVRRWYGL
ncbi:MAG: peptidoglycan endopeptidase [Deltaproteobacteria bacterium]|nr:peptidoglycan endopeptidase [Deltaproteobacteria bacterium]